MPINATTPSPVHRALSSRDAAADEPVYRKFQITVPAEEEGMALSSLNGLASTALPDVDIRAKRRVIFGRNAEIDIVARGTPRSSISCRP